MYSTWATPISTNANDKAATITWTPTVFWSRIVTRSFHRPYASVARFGAGNHRLPFTPATIDYSKEIEQSALIISGMSDSFCTEYSVPGQGGSLSQSLLSCSSPRQSRPPCCGLGLLQYRSLDCLHVSEQSLHLLQRLHDPSTTRQHTITLQLPRITQLTTWTTQKENIEQRVT